ncbi:MAG: hypothetical protein COC22_04920 [Flavobacteriaceae bacterium]|nr:MAG: hypothetical protein COC22_04920 [Flavobacteriaceae bacterium]
MKKQFLNLGKALNKAEQKLINGGTKAYDGCVTGADCIFDEDCHDFGIQCNQCVDGGCSL